MKQHYYHYQQQYRSYLQQLQNRPRAQWINVAAIILLLISLSTYWLIFRPLWLTYRQTQQELITSNLQVMQQQKQLSNLLPPANVMQRSMVLLLANPPMTHPLSPRQLTEVIAQLLTQSGGVLQSWEQKTTAVTNGTAMWHLALHVDYPGLQRLLAALQEINDIAIAHLWITAAEQDLDVVLELAVGNSQVGP